MNIYYEKPEFIELTEVQTRQYIDAEAAWRALEDAKAAAAEVRGSMMWRTQAGQRYLIRVAAFGGQTSLGPQSPENKQLYERFMARKLAAETRLKQLRQTVAQHIRLNRALRVGRVPNVVVDTLNALARAIAFTPEPEGPGVILCNRGVGQRFFGDFASCV
jgi:hypothetical protein